MMILKQLRIRICIDRCSQYFVEHYIGHHHHKCHKINGPALIWSSGSKSWLVNNIHHRADGPALIRANGSKYWCVNGKYIEVIQYE